MSKKSVLKRLIQIAAFCLVFAVCLNGVYKVLSWKDTTGTYYSTTETLYNMEDDLADVLFLGSSHCYCSINNAKLWNDYGMGSFSMVISGQDLASTYYSFKEALKTQTPDVVFAELYGISFEEHAVTANIYRNTLSFKYSDNFFGVVDAIAPEQDKMDYLLKWPIIHTRYKELQKGDFTPIVPAFLGYTAQFEHTEVDPVVAYENPAPVAISEKNQQWLQKIVDLAEEKDIEICFFVVPYVTDENNQGRFAYTENFLKQQGVTVVNMFRHLDEINLDSSKDFYDSGHTNSYGAEKVTAFIGKYINENYDIPDRRGDAQYDYWETDYQVFKHRTEHYALRNTEDIEDYFNMLANMENYTVAVSLTGEYISDSKDIADSLNKLGLNSEFTEKGGVLVIDSHNVVYKTQQDSFLHYRSLTNGDLSVRGTLQSPTVTVDRTDYKPIENGINIVVYDNLLGEVVEYVRFNALDRYEIVR